MNPGGSVKDRIGPAIIEAAEREGALRPGGTIVEGTSGNTGVGLALAAARKGYRCIFTIPDKMSQEKVRLLKAFGAEVIVTPTAVPPDHPDNYVVMAKRIAQETPNAVLANQFYNEANPEAHYRTTGPEIWEQTEGARHPLRRRGGHRRHHHRRRALPQGAEPARPRGRRRPGGLHHPRLRGDGDASGEGAPYKVEGIGQDKIPGTLDMDVVDEWRSVDDRAAFAIARRLTREEGLFVGGSSGLIAARGPRGGPRGGRPGRLRRLHPPRHRRALPLQALQRRVDAREPAHRARARRRRRAWWAMKGERRPAGAGLRRARRPRCARRSAYITEHNISQLPVLAEGDCVGHVSEATLMARVLENPTLLDQPVQELMDPPLPVVDAPRRPRRRHPPAHPPEPRRAGAPRRRAAGIITRYDVLRYVTGGR